MTETAISDKFYEIVNEAVVSHVCSHEDVIEVCSRWFITERREMSELPRLLEVYGELRDLGHDHSRVLNGLCSAMSRTTPDFAATTTTLPTEITSRADSLQEEWEKVKKEIQQKIIDDDIRMLRDD